MSRASTLGLSAGHVLGSVWKVARYALRFSWAVLLPKARLAARVLAAESQLAVERNRSGGRQRRRQFSPAFRMLWVVLSKLLDGWEDLAHLMKPATVKRWHTTAFRHGRNPGKIAVARCLLDLIYHMLNKGQDYRAPRDRKAAA
jgi:hypothetical protein